MVRLGYNWNAQDYAKNSANQFQWAKELIPKLHLRCNEALLDLGCGDGKITAELAKCLPLGKAVGIDSSKQMINLARNSFPERDYVNLSFKVMDARKLTFLTEFDIVFSNAALHWIVDHKAVLSGVQRSLKPGGRILFQMAGKGNAKDVIDILDELVPVEPWRQYFTNFSFPYGFYDAKDYKAFLSEAGLVAGRVELFPKDMKLDGAAGLAGWIRTTWMPFTQKLPERLRARFIDEIVRHYVELHPADHAGTVHVGMMRLEVEAFKP